MAGNSNFDALLSTTLKNYTPRIEDNIFSNLTLLYWLKEAGHIEKVSGGEQIVEPLMYSANGTTGSYGGYDNIPTTPQEGITSAVYDWKQYAVSIAISGIEEAKNRGEQQVVSLLKAKIDQAEMSLQDSMNTMLYGNGAGNGGKDWLGLQNFVGLIGDPTDSVTKTHNTVGGITSNSTDNLWWRNRSVDAGADVVDTAAGDRGILTNMSRIYNLCTKGKIKPEFVLTSQAVWERYESALQPQLRYQSTKSADAGFENLLYKSAPVMWDEDIPGSAANNGTSSGNPAASNVAYFLNSKFLKLKVHSDVWMKATPMEKPHGQDARYSQILSYGNLTCNNRRFQGLLYGIDVA